MEVGWRIGTVTFGLTVALVGCAPSPPPATPLASTDIFLIELSFEEGRPSLGAPENLTHRAGYDNQPAFLPDGGSFVYASSDGTQTDCLRYDLATHHSEPVTQSAEREYSPQPIPGREQIAVVRVDAEGRQRLWQLGLHGEDPYLLFEWEDRVGYQAWIDGSLVALRIEDQPPELHFGNADTGWVEAAPVLLDVGRCLQPVPARNALSYVHKLAEGDWWIEELDLLTREAHRVVRALPGSEDFAWGPRGERLWMARGSHLFSLVPGAGAEWVEVADLSKAGLREITRLAVSPRGDAILVVALPPEP